MYKIFVKFLDLLVFVFIFLNTFLIDISVFGLRLRYIIFIMCILMVIIISKKITLSKTIISYTLFGFWGAMLLFIYSLIIRSNPISNVMWFVKPYMFWLLIPVFAILFKENGLKRYLKMFSITVFLLTVLYLSVYILYFYDSDLAKSICEMYGNFSLSEYEGIPRVIVKNIVFLFPLLLYVFIYVKTRLLKFIAIFYVLFIMLLTQTMGLILGFASIILVKLLVDRKFITLTVIIACMILALYVFSQNYTEWLSHFKIYSIEVKLEQLYGVLSQMDFVDYLFGKGIGAEIINSDRRLLQNDYVIEVAPLLMLFVGGIFGSIILFFIYVFPTFLVAFSDQIRKDENMKILLYSHAAIIVTSLSNPYIWSGGIGLFFVCMIIASFNNENLKRCRKLV